MMGFIHESHGTNRIGVEERSESFYLRPGYGWDADGNDYSDRHGSFGEHWRDRPSPEFLLKDVPDIIRALADLPTCPKEVRDALAECEPAS